MKKILHVSKYYHPFKGGTEQIARECVCALKNKYEQKVICFNHGEGNKIDLVDKVEVIRCKSNGQISSQTISFSYGKMLKCVFNDFKPDIVIFHYPNPFVAHYLLKCLSAQIKFVIYWHLDIVKQKILKNFSTCAVRFYSHTTKLGTQIQWICSFLGHYKRNLSLSEPDILIVILIDHFDSSKGTASML